MGRFVHIYNVKNTSGTSKTFKEIIEGLSGYMSAALFNEERGGDYIEEALDFQERYSMTDSAIEKYTKSGQDYFREFKRMVERIYPELPNLDLEKIDRDKESVDSKKIDKIHWEVFAYTNLQYGDDEEVIQPDEEFLIVLGMNSAGWWEQMILVRNNHIGTLTDPSLNYTHYEKYLELPS